jgi:DNA mismatch repair protein MutS
MQQTPLMAQYFKIKEANPDTILLFRVGDFFETFEEDANFRIMPSILTYQSS